MPVTSDLGISGLIVSWSANSDNSGLIRLNETKLSDSGILEVVRMYEDETVNLTATLTASGASASKDSNVFYTFRLLPQTSTAVKARLTEAISGFNYPVQVLDVTSGIANNTFVGQFSSGVDAYLKASLSAQADFLASGENGFDTTWSLIYTSGANSGVVTINSGTGVLTYNPALELSVASEAVTVRLVISIETADGLYDFTITREWDLELIKNKTNLG